MFEDNRIETNIVGEHSVKKLLKGENSRPVGGTGGDGITKTHEFLKDIDAHVIRRLTIESERDILETNTFNIILGSSAPIHAESHASKYPGCLQNVALQRHFDILQHHFDILQRHRDIWQRHMTLPDVI